MRKIKASTISVTSHIGNLVLFFSSPTCQYCDSVRLILKEIDNSHITCCEFYEIEPDNETVLISYGIQVFPTVLILKHGRVVSYIASKQDKNKYIDELDKSDVIILEKKK